MSHVLEEIGSQPQMWRRAAEAARAAEGRLPAAGQRVAIVGCGTSLFMAQAWAAAREQVGQGETDAFTPSEAPPRRYDVVVALTHSGMTTEVLDYVKGLASTSRTVAVTGTPSSPVGELCDDTVLLEFADGRSVVQARPRPSPPSQQIRDPSACGRGLAPPEAEGPRERETLDPPERAGERGDNDKDPQRPPGRQT